VLPNKKLLSLLLTLGLCSSVLALADDPLKVNVPAAPNTPTDIDIKNQKLFSLGSTFATQGVDGLKSAAVNAVTSEMNSEAVGISTSFLKKYFPTVELEVNLFDFQRQKSGLLLVVPLSDPNDVKHTLFMQDSIYHSEGSRTTVNLGLGYRQLELDNKLLLGVNAFYDHEFPYENARTSFGLEARTTVADVNFNQYFSASGWRSGANDLQEHSLGGTDLEVGLALPYMPWAKIYAKDFIWYGVDGATNIRGNDVSFHGNVPTFPGLSIEAGHRTLMNAAALTSNPSTNTIHSDQNFLKISYNLMEMGKPNFSAPLFESEAYSFRSMENHRYDKIRRENLIVKQTRASNGTISVLGI
jgi:adhesin/invasin